MDSERKRQLKALGKAEVARQSEALHSALQEANPAKLSDGQWGPNYRKGVERERWLRRKLPVLRAARLQEMFVVHPWGANTWSPHTGGYVLCKCCGSAVPSAVPRKLFRWLSCECGNIRFVSILWWGRRTVKDPSAVLPVKLLGKG
jgi:hypothetical protein